MAQNSDNELSSRTRAGEASQRGLLRRALRGAAIVWSVVALVAHSDTGVAFPLWMTLAGTGLLIAAAWLIALLVALVAAWTQEPGGAGTLRSWLAIPIPIVATLLAIWLALPLRARLFFSGPALRQSAAFLAQLPPSRFQEHPPWIGLFRVRQFAQYGDELRFLTSPCGLVDTCGVVFSPDRPPPNRGEDTFEHLYGAWWHWHQSW
jgi:hypothetical protein